MPLGWLGGTRSLGGISPVQQEKVAKETRGICAERWEAVARVPLTSLKSVLLVLDLAVGRLTAF